jgi:hypothetical protein
MDAYTDRFGFTDDTYYGDEDAERAAYPDLRNDSHYCKHGNYIGTPYGADYMCHWCEMGEEPEVLTYEVTVTFRREVQATSDEAAMDRVWTMLRDEAEENNDMAFEFSPKEVS